MLLFHMRKSFPLSTYFPCHFDPMHYHRPLIINNHSQQLSARKPVKRNTSTTYFPTVVLNDTLHVLTLSHWPSNPTSVFSFCCLNLQEK